MEATITLEYYDAKTAEAVASAVSPDNLKTPTGLSIKTVCTGNKVLTTLESKGKLVTFIATIDDLLFSVATAEKTIRIVKKGEEKQKMG